MSNHTIYIASLPDYNSGNPYGAWFNLDDYCGVDDLQEAIDDLLAGSPEAERTGFPTEEWAIHDYEGLGDISEFTPLSEVWAAHEALRQVGEGEEEALLAYVEVQGGWEYAANFQDAYYGKYDSEVHFIQELLKDTGMFKELPEGAQCYFDYEAYAGDVFLGGDFMFRDGCVFSRNV